MGSFKQIGKKAMKKAAVPKSPVKAKPKAAMKSAASKSPMKAAAKPASTSPTKRVSFSQDKPSPKKMKLEETCGMTAVAKASASFLAKPKLEDVMMESKIKREAQLKSLGLKGAPPAFRKNLGLPADPDDDSSEDEAPLSDEMKARILNRMNDLKKEKELASNEGLAAASSTPSASYEGPGASSAASLQRSSDAVTVEG